MATAYERKTPSLPNKIYLSNSNGQYFSVYQGLISLKDKPDYTCVVLVEYLTDNLELFYLRCWEGSYWEISDAYHCFQWKNKTVNAATIQFTLLDVKAKDTFAFRTGNGDFIQLDDDSFVLGQLVPGEFPAATVVVSKAFIRRVVSDPVYDTQSSVVTDMIPDVALKMTVRNDSDSDKFTETLTYSYEVSRMGSWTTTSGQEVAIAASAKFGIPFLNAAKVGVEVTVTVNHKKSLTGSKTNTNTVTSTSKVAVPPNSQALATVLIFKATIDVPFTYTESTWYNDGTYEEVTQNGIYNNVESYQVDVQVTGISSTISDSDVESNSSVSGSEGSYADGM